MIPHRYIQQWRREAPWADDEQVEQDLVISRALVEIFSNPLLKDALAFRGGTALYKLYLRPAARYSEDIDLVQVRPEPAGAMLGALRSTFASWLGQPEWKQTHGRITLYYRFASESPARMPLQLKIEVNSREHFSVYGYCDLPFEVASGWREGACAIRGFQLDELLATKLRALYQRKQGRDLFDLALALEDRRVDPQRVVRAFCEYMARGGHRASRGLFEQNLRLKLADPIFTADLRPLLAPGLSWDPQAASLRVMEELVARIPGKSRSRPAD